MPTHAIFAEKDRSPVDAGQAKRTGLRCLKEIEAIHRENDRVLPSYRGGTGTERI